MKTADEVLSEIDATLSHLAGGNCLTTRDVVAKMNYDEDDTKTAYGVLKREATNALAEYARRGPETRNPYGGRMRPWLWGAKGERNPEYKVPKPRSGLLPGETLYRIEEKLDRILTLIGGQNGRF